MPQAEEYISQGYFKIDGRDSSRAMESGVREITVDTSLYQPDMFSIQLNDPDLSFMDSDLLFICKEIEISGKAMGQSESSTLTKGIVVAIEPEFN